MRYIQLLFGSLLYRGIVNAIPSPSLSTEVETKRVPDEIHPSLDASLPADLSLQRRQPPPDDRPPWRGWIAEDPSEEELGFTLLDSFTYIDDATAQIMAEGVHRLIDDVEQKGFLSVKSYWIDVGSEPAARSYSQRVAAFKDEPVTQQYYIRISWRNDARMVLSPTPTQWRITGGVDGPTSAKEWVTDRLKRISMTKDGSLEDYFKFEGKKLLRGGRLRSPDNRYELVYRVFKRQVMPITDGSPQFGHPPGFPLWRHFDFLPGEEKSSRQGSSEQGKSGQESSGQESSGQESSGQESSGQDNSGQGSSGQGSSGQGSGKQEEGEGEGEKCGSW
ncbi:MAG: hypothetical protein M1837_007552 [Sclerophora amabilis]|nr:MAG: hypothetical protein M1837_007552 [Sclerophora amabilis]